MTAVTQNVTSCEPVIVTYAQVQEFLQDQMSLCLEQVFSVMAREVLEQGLSFVFQSIYQHPWPLPTRCQ